MLKVQHISKTYKKPVICDLSFAVEKGEIIGIAGKNGSGKSTLMKMIASIVTPDQGAIFLDEQNILIHPTIAKKHIGYVPQENALFNDLTVKDNISFFMGLYGKKYNDLGIPKDFLSKKVKHLSGGMRKRVNILLSMFHEPDYVLMDEPTANLDLYYKREVMQLIQSYKDKGKSIVFTTHDMEELSCCDKVFVIQDGRFVYEGTPEPLFKEDALYKMIASTDSLVITKL